MRRLTPTMLGVVVLGTGASSVALNAWFWASRSMGALEAVIAGVLGGGLDVMKVVASGMIVLVIARGDYGKAMILLAIIAVGMVASALAAIGFYFDNRAATIGVSVVKSKVADLDVQELERRQRERAAITVVMTRSEIEARIAGILSRVPARLKEGGRCATWATSSECSEVRELSLERERGERAEALDREIAVLRARVGSGLAEHGRAADGQVVMLARVFGVGTEQVETALAIMFALIVEIVTAGSAFLLAVQTQMGTASAPVSTTMPSTAEVARLFVAEMTARSRRLHVGRDELLDAVGAFCAARAVREPDWEEVSVAMAAGGGRQVMLRGEPGFVGIGLKHNGES